MDYGHGRGCDCDTCYSKREHASHRHCDRCRDCMPTERDSDNCAECDDQSTARAEV